MKEVVLTGKVKSVVESRGTVYVNIYIAVKKDGWTEELAALFRPGSQARFRVSTVEQPLQLRERLV